MKIHTKHWKIPWNHTILCEKLKITEAKALSIPDFPSAALEKQWLLSFKRMIPPARPFFSRQGVYGEE